MPAIAVTTTPNRLLLAAAIIRRHDRDSDQRLTSSEWGRGVASFDRFDRNDDGAISAGELAESLAATPVADLTRLQRALDKNEFVGAAGGGAIGGIGLGLLAMVPAGFGAVSTFIPIAALGVGAALAATYVVLGLRARGAGNPTEIKRAILAAIEASPK